MDERTSERDATIERVRATLAPLPPVAPSSIARVLAATARRPAPSPWARFRAWITTPSLSLAGAGGIAVVALVLGFAVRGVWSARGTPALVATATTTAEREAAQATVAGAGGAITARAVAAEGARVAVQLVFEAPRATSVSVVGDFNEWRPTATPMQQLEAGQPWTAVVLVAPGRHTYAFLVDGRRWIADPRAPRAADDDFGKPGSVLFVRAP